MTQEEARSRLAGLREEIDAIDQRIVDLLNQRASIAERIGDTKEAAGLPVIEPGREQQVIERVAARNRGPLEHDAVKKIYECIMLEMRRIQFVRMETKEKGSGE